MKLFYGEITQDDIVNIDSEEQLHIAKVLRMKPGEELFVTDGKGNLAKGTLQFLGKKVLMEVLEIQRDLPNFQQYLHIAIAPTKNMDRIDFFVEKATEMGVSEITFLQTDKTERKHINIDKIIKQSIAASKQSLRFHFPKINNLTKFSDFQKNINPNNTFVAHCDSSLERVSLQQIVTDNPITILIGPEGDFSPKEIQEMSRLGVQSISLGQQRLRTETAGIFVVAWHYSQSFGK